MSNTAQVASLHRITKRLINSGNWDKETIDSIVKGLQEEEHWPLYKICAYLDIIDLEDRT